eukprot:Cvel_27072.t1-p1 / transcript=Cvel_27072.t1 / gene=Cvel_27072 / organism=Chromera_velia_CCMP2878 / gene_product=hypothetical protein / transcript_product=hypothetical protein / location=Cvel_scaffold3314:11486-12931(+) / protein_length=388 / sequence_SO=supercontig / SO=protein_coding / is_pseudo=false
MTHTIAMPPPMYGLEQRPWTVRDVVVKSQWDQSNQATPFLATFDLLVTDTELVLIPARAPKSFHSEHVETRRIPMRAIRLAVFESGFYRSPSRFYLTSGLQPGVRLSIELNDGTCFFVHDFDDNLFTFRHHFLCRFRRSLEAEGVRRAWGWTNISEYWHSYNESWSSKHYFGASGPTLASRDNRQKFTLGAAQTLNALVRDFDSQLTAFAARFPGRISLLCGVNDPSRGLTQQALEQDIWALLMVSYLKGEGHPDNLFPVILKVENERRASGLSPMNETAFGLELLRNKSLFSGLPNLPSQPPQAPTDAKPLSLSDLMGSLDDSSKEPWTVEDLDFAASGAAFFADLQQDLESVSNSPTETTRKGTFHSSDPVPKVGGREDVIAKKKD